MKQEISKRDWELISAYLDGQLSAKKLARFEARLTQDPILREALNELHNTRMVLQNTPRLRVPRNFLLTAELVGSPRQLPRMAPTFGWISAVASLLFVFIVMGDFFRSSGGTVSVAVNDVNTQPVVVDAAVAPKSSAPQTESSETIFSVPAGGGLSEIPTQESLADAQLKEFVAAAEIEPESEVVPTLEQEPTQQTEFETVAEAPPEESITLSEAMTETTRSLQTEEAAIDSQEILPTETPLLTVQEGGHHIEKTATKEPVFGEAANVTDTPPAIAPTTEVALFLENSAATPESDLVDTEIASAEISPDENLELSVPQEEAQTQVVNDRTDNLISVAKVLLLLLAVGTGIAGLYIRQRGG